MKQSNISTKVKIFILPILLFAFSCNIYSQNLSFEELLSLQKETKKKTEKFFQEKKWEKDVKTVNKWMHKKENSTENVDAIFTI